MMQLPEADVTPPVPGDHEKAAPASAVHGALDVMSHYRIAGWVWDPASPDERLTVRFWVDDRFEAESTANIFRLDLQQNAIGDGSYGFEFTPPASMIDGSQHRIRVTTQPGDRLVGEHSVEFFPYQGCLETILNDTARGWARHILQPAEPISIDIRLGDRLQATGQADSYREDLVTALGGSGKYAFSIPLPVPIMEGRCEIRAVYSGTDIDLRNSPMILETRHLLATAPPAKSPAPTPRVAAQHWTSEHLQTATNLLLQDVQAHRGPCTPPELSAYRAALSVRFALEHLQIWQSKPLLETQWIEQSPVSLCFDTEFVRAALRLEASASSTEVFQQFLHQSTHALVRPNLLFDEAWYIRNNLDAHAAISTGETSCGLEHFVTTGLSEGRSPTLWFNPGYYAQQLGHSAQDMTFAWGALVLHFLFEGCAAGLSPSRYFQTDHYLREYPAARRAIARREFSSSFEHYLREGTRAGLSPHPMFHEKDYLQQRPAVQLAVENAVVRSGLEWFLLFGSAEGDIFDRASMVRALARRNAELAREQVTLLQDREQLAAMLREFRLLTRSWLSAPEATEPAPADETDHRPDTSRFVRRLCRISF